MPKRKLDSSLSVPTPVTPKRSRLAGGILKAEGTPNSGHNKSVTFPPPADLAHTLNMFTTLEEDSQIGDEEMASLLSMLEHLRGPSLIMWLEELQKNVGVLGSQVRMEEFVMELLKLSWADQGETVARAFIEFLVSLISANVKFVKPAVKILVENLKGTNDQISDPDLLQNTHEAFKGMLEVAPLTSREEILRQIVNRFPFYKMPTYKQICYISSVLEMSRYIPDSREQILRLVMERLIKLDAHLSRDYIDAAYRQQSEGTCSELDRTVQTMDMYMELMFTFVKESTHEKNEDGVEEFRREKAGPLVDCLLDIHVSHLLPTFNITHTQFLFLYLASLAPDISLKFMNRNWKTFINVNQPSVIRQTAIAYIASYLARAKVVSSGQVISYLDRISGWAMDYVNTRDSSVEKGDFVLADISRHGPFYAACQAIFYVFAFRHSEITNTVERISKLKAMSWQSLVTASLNPLRVCLPGIVKSFAAISKDYQLAYCTAILERNNRINLPMVGSMTNATAKPILLDSLFPFDPYMLEVSKRFVQGIYRLYTGDFVMDDTDEEGDDAEEENEDGDTPDSGLGRRRRRGDSLRSSNSSCGRLRKDSMGHLNDLLMQDIVSSTGFE